MTMITINQYLNNVFDDFSEYVSGSESLCKLKELTFEAGNTPDYNSKYIQQLYLLRYTFAYAFEYKKMYTEILERLGGKKIEVTSLGCGPMTDYWSLCQANKDHSFEYIGIDVLNWEYKFESIKSNPYSFIQNNMVEYIRELDALHSDIYFFPKSISEIRDNDLTNLCDCFQTKRITKDKIFIGVSLRSDKTSYEMDSKKLDSIQQAIKKNGFNRIFKTEYPEDVKKAIISCDSSFVYPDEAKNLLADLFEKCNSYEEDKCGKDCQEHLVRHPVLTTNNIRYRILEFERAK